MTCLPCDLCCPLVNNNKHNLIVKHLKRGCRSLVNIPLCLCDFYLLVEGPFEQSVTQSPHHHKEQGQVAATPCPISVQIDPQTHLVAVLTRVES